jgi:hypothetical protein
MNVSGFGSNWRRRFTTGFFALGWIVALVLAFSKGPLFETARAQTAQPMASPSKGPYSPIGLTFDNCVTQSGALQSVPIKLIAKLATDPAPPLPAGYLYMATLHNFVDFVDSAGVDHPSGAAVTDVIIYVKGVQQQNC